MKARMIVKFAKSDEGVEVVFNNTKTVDVLIGIAEAIQLITEETKQSRQDVVSDINKILDILEEQEKKEGEN